MPIVEALNLVGDDFTNYVQKARQRDVVVPDDVYNLLIDTIEERPLTLKEIEKMMMYMEGRQYAIVASMNKPVPTGKVFLNLFFLIFNVRGQIFCLVKGELCGCMQINLFESPPAFE